MPSVCAEHGVIVERLEQHEKRLDGHDSKVDDLVKAVAEIRGAWKFSVALGTLVGTVAGVAAELLMRGHP